MEGGLSPVLHGLQSNDDIDDDDIDIDTDEHNDEQHSNNLLMISDDPNIKQTESGICAANQQCTQQFRTSADAHCDEYDSDGRVDDTATNTHTTHSSNDGGTGVDGGLSPVSHVFHPQLDDSAAVGDADDEAKDDNCVCLPV